jgi:hypothetical protein
MEGAIHQPGINMTEDAMQELAMRVASILESNSISRLIPAETAQWLRESTFGTGMRYHYVMPLAGGNALQILMNITIAGEVEIELHDTTGMSFWRGTLREMRK